MACFIAAGSVNDSVDWIPTPINCGVSVAVSDINMSTSITPIPGGNLLEPRTINIRITSKLVNWKTN